MSEPGSLPETLFVFVDADDPIVRHNLEATNSIFSPAVAYLGQDEHAQERYVRGEVDWLPFVPNPESTGFTSFFTARQAIAMYRVEYEAERVRRLVAPGAPSRLSAVYAFRDQATCEEVACRYGWELDQVRRFRPRAVLRAARCNMEIVSFARGLARAPVTTDEETSRQLWTTYWFGGDEAALELPVGLGPERRVVRSGPPIWEYLIDGSLELVD